MIAKPPILVRVSRRYDAAPERVFDAWLDPAMARQFLFAADNGEMVRAEIDPRVGGAFAFVDRRDGEDVAHTGEYLEIERPSRLVFVYAVDGSDSDRVSVDIVPLESGCELTLTHEMAPEWAEYEDRTAQGWTEILAGVAAALGEDADS